MIKRGVASFAVLVFAMATAVDVRAQQAPPRSGITVVGTGVVRRPADVAHFTISLSNNAGRGSPDDALKAADDFVRALKAAGVDDASIVNPLNGLITAQRFVTVSGALRKPSYDRVVKLIALVNAVVPGNSILIQNVNASLSLDDCTTALGIAEKAAFDDARERALRLAADAHLTLGSATAMAELGNLGFSGTCPTKPDTIVNLNGAGNLSTTNAFEVALPVNLTVTFSAN